MSSAITLTPGNAQNIGSREQQQDAFGFSDITKNAHGVMAVVADGMGGLEHGDKASQLVVQTFLQGFEQGGEQGFEHNRTQENEDNIPVSLLQLGKLANEQVLNLADCLDQGNNVGSTLVAVWVKADQLYFLSVGDSRIYLYRDHEMSQLTQDHNYSMTLFGQVAKGEITQQEALDDPQFDALISFLGNEALEHVDHNIKPIPLKPGDSIILCSDGLYRGLEREEWLGVLAEQDLSSPTATQKKAEALLDLVLTKQRNNQDNATIALIDVAAPRQSAEAFLPGAAVANNKMNKVNKSLSGALIVVALLLCSWLFWPNVPEEALADERVPEQVPVQVIVPEQPVADEEPKGTETAAEPTVSEEPEDPEEQPMVEPKKPDDTEEKS